MPVAPFDFSSLLPAGPAAAKWTGAARYNFIGGNNDPGQIPVDALAAAATAVLTREDPTLASCSLKSGPQGYRPLREFIAVWAILLQSIRDSAVARHHLRLSRVQGQCDGAVHIRALAPRVPGAVTAKAGSDAARTT